MQIRRKVKGVYLFVGVLLCMNGSFAQTPLADTVFIPYGQILVLKDTIITPSQDTLIILTDGYKYKVKKNPYLRTESFFDSLNTKSKKNRLMDELYRATIRHKKKPPPDTTNLKKPELIYTPYHGYNIREIHFAQVDLISGSVMDTSIKADDGFSKILNNTHIHTKENVIRKNLVFKEGDNVDANRMVENERFLRTLRFIDDARIVLIPIDSNQVDVLVITQDLFPWSFSGTGSNYNIFSVTADNRNLAGTGHGFRDRVYVDGRYDPIIGNRFDYEWNNIYSSFINFNFRIFTTPNVDNSYARFTKSFITPETKYAGGMEINYLRDKMGLSYPDSSVVYSFKKTTENFWIGRSIMLNKEKRSNLVFTLRYNPIQYQKRPLVTPDSNQVFQNSHLTLGAVSFLQYKTIKTMYLKSFGRVEDVPYGFVGTFTAGYLTSDIWRIGYLSIRAGYAKSFNNGGYFRVASDLGSFFYKGTPLQGLFMIKTGFFSPLIKVSNSQLRFGGQLQYKNGLNRFKYEWINLSDEVRGVSTNNGSGTSKTTFTAEAVLFTKTYLYGFRLAPYVFTNYGTIRNDLANPYEGRFYSGIGLGLRIRNEHLVFNTLDISFVVYPNRQTGDKLYRVLIETSEPEVFQDIVVGEPYVLPF